MKNVMSEMQLLTWFYTRIIQITQPPMCLEMRTCKAISLDDTERPVATLKAKWEGNGGEGACLQKKILGPCPLEC